MKRMQLHGLEMHTHNMKVNLLIELKALVVATFE